MIPPGPVVVFSYAGFTEEFPEFSALSQAQCQGYFNRAQAFFANNTCNPAFGVDGTGLFMGSMLNLLTAHIAWLNAPRDSNGNPSATGSSASTPAVGMIKSASEGSVSVGLDIGDVAGGSPSQPYYMQTRYGTEFWFATAGFRTAIYAANPTRVVQPAYRGRNGNW